MSSNLPASWDSARRKTRTLESTIDAKLIAYSRLASSIPRSETGAASSSGDHTAVTIDDESQAQRAEHESLEVELERLLSQVSDNALNVVVLYHQELEAALFADRPRPTLFQAGCSSLWDGTNASHTKTNGNCQFAEAASLTHSLFVVFRDFTALELDLISHKHPR